MAKSGGFKEVMYLFLQINAAVKIKHIKEVPYMQCDQLHCAPHLTFLFFTLRKTKVLAYSVF